MGDELRAWFTGKNICRLFKVCSICNSLFTSCMLALLFSSQTKHKLLDKPFALDNGGHFGHFNARKRVVIKWHEK